MKVLSSSPFRDPFTEAQKKFDSKKGTVLSSSTPPPLDTPPAPVDLSPLLQRIGVDGANLANNEIGRMQLISRLREKLGENFYQNPDALELLSTFDENAKLADQSQTNKMLSNADRTLKALFAGSGGV